MNRRHFLRLSIGAAAIAAVPIALKEAIRRQLPVIVGDGIHDDTAGLQAAINGEEFVCESGLVKMVDGGIYLDGGSYLISKTVTIPNDAHGTIMNARFDYWPTMSREDPLLEILAPA